MKDAGRALIVTKATKEALNDDFRVIYFTPRGVKLNILQMDEGKLRKLGYGFYVDDNRALYFKLREFMAAHNLSDTPEVRKAVWKQVRDDFGVIEITELPDE